LPWMQNKWHYIHFANYAVFTSVWIHSWFLGSDVQATSLKYLWIFYLITAIAATFGRITRGLSGVRPFVTATSVSTNGTLFLTVAGNGAAKQWQKIASIDDVTPQGSFCATIQDQQIALFNIKGKFYAIDNICTHAGGPLCEGTLSENVVQCPWHGSKFDVTTGNVISRPANTPVKRYEVRVVGNDIEIAL